MTELLPGENADYLLALGRFIQKFAAAEMSLDVANSVIFFHAEGGRAIAPQIPTTLDQKITFFRKAHASIPSLAPLAVRGAEIANRFLELKEPRHFLVHGMQDHSIRDGAITKVKFVRSVPTEQITRIPAAKLNEMGDEAWNLTKKTMAQGLLLVRTLLTDDQIDEAFSNIE